MASLLGAVKKKLTGKDVGIPVRKMGLTYDDQLPTLWFGNNGFLTAVFSGFSATLPEGEDQFVYSVRLFQDKITDPVLKAQVRAFIGQEAHHSREHELLNKTLTERGLPLDKVDATIRSMNLFFRKYQSPEDQLAATVCGEHLTALLADWALTHTVDGLDRMAPVTRQAWAWHAIEELEHKSVAFDVYDQLVGDRKRLQRTMVLVTAVFMGMTTFQALRMMPKTGQLTHVGKWREAISVLGKLLRESRDDYLDFFRDDYHPVQHDARDIIRMAREKYLGETDVLDKAA